MINGVIHTGISTRDMEKSIWFYEKVLGGRIIMEIEEPKGTPWIVCIQFPDKTCIELFYPRADFPLGDQLGRNHLCLGTGDIYALEKHLDAHLIEITSRPKKVRDANLQLWCVDPNGYPLEFIQLMPGCPQLSEGEKVILW